MFTGIKAHHGMKHTENAVSYIKDEEKTDLSRHQDRLDGVDPLVLDDHTKNLFDYSTNPNKTVIISETGEETQLVSGYNVDPVMVNESFQLAMDKYRRTHREKLGMQTARRVMRAKLDEEGNPVLDSEGRLIYDEAAPVYHDPVTGKCVYEKYKKQTKARTSYGWVLSCPPKEVIGFDIDPRIVHQLGLEFCERMFRGDYQALVATHCDRKHIHNHITMCAYSTDGSHKYRDTKESLMVARHIADDLSLKFGIPITAEVPNDVGHHMDWSEWKKKEQGDSWKEVLKKDIASAARVATSFPQYLELMKDCGYGIRETENHITYIMPGENEYRCRDTRLGKEYTKAELQKYYEERTQQQERGAGKDADREVPIESGGKPHHMTIRVSRYTLKGRRRSDLEMVFLIALKIIRLIKDLFRDMEAAKINPENPVHRDFAWKEHQMLDSLRLSQVIGVENKAELDDLVHDTGQRLSVARKEEKELGQDISYMHKIFDLTDEVRELQEKATAAGFNGDLELYDISPEDMRANVAREAPATPSQRRNMYIMLQNYNGAYRPSVRYDEISAMEAEKMIRFLQGKNEERPAILLTDKEWEARSPKEKYNRSQPGQITREMEQERRMKDIRFEAKVSIYPAEKQQIIAHYRDVSQQLRNLGIEPEAYDNVHNMAESSIEKLERIGREIEELKIKYRNLSRLKYNYELATNEKFVYGADYEKKKEDSVSIEETQETTLKDDDERRIERTEAKSRYRAEDTRAYQFPDRYFDATHRDL